jgi:hypothetical protein
MTIYMPDDLAAEVKAELGDSNVSAICQAALRAELDRARARARITEKGFERVEVYDGKRERDVAFQGREIGYADHLEQTAYLTPKDSIVVYSDDRQEMWVYDDYEEFVGNQDDPNHPDELIAQVAEALGEKYVEELDI